MQKRRLKIYLPAKACLISLFTILMVLTIMPSHASMLIATLGMNAAEQSLSNPEPVIDANTNKIQDSDIQSRIQGIFAEIDSLKNIHVTVSEGVVTLSGQTANDTQAQSALRLANRLSGVVTVQDRMERTLNVQDNIQPVFSDLTNKLIGFVKALPLLIIAIIVFLLISLLGSLIAKQDKFWRQLTTNPFVAEILSQAIRIGFIIAGLIIALSFLGAGAIISTLLGGAGVIGFAIGFAIRDTIENYIASIMLSLRQPFRAKDHVVIDEHEGIVVRLTSRATILMTLAGNHLRIPNAKVFKGIILNYSTNPERRFDFELGVDANDDPIAAMQTGLAAIKTHDFILLEPEPAAFIQTVGDSNIVLCFTAWINQTSTDLFKARSLAIHCAKNALENAGFSLPEPIYRLRFDVTPPWSEHTTPHQLTDTNNPNDEPQTKHKPNLVQSTQHNADNLDVAPDQHLAQKVNKEVAQGQTDDLLDNNSPKE